MRGHLKAVWNRADGTSETLVDRDVHVTTEGQNMVLVLCPDCAAYGREKHDSSCPLHPDYDPSPDCTCGQSPERCKCYSADND